jgi:hypothetical protein
MYFFFWDQETGGLKLSLSSYSDEIKKGVELYLCSTWYAQEKLAYFMITVHRIVKPCILSEKNKSFGGTSYLHLIFPS